VPPSSNLSLIGPLKLMQPSTPLASRPCSLASQQEEEIILATKELIIARMEKD